MLLSCITSTNADTIKSNNDSIPQNIGGWYPVFFESYDIIKLNHIISSIKNDMIGKVVINYDKNYTLAIKIQKYIILETDFPINLNHTIQKDDKFVNYNHDQVVVIIWNK